MVAALRFTILLVFSAGLLTAAAGHAAMISVDLGAANFGNLKQTDTTACSGIDGTQACGPSAAANSLYFLQKKYPEVYGQSLVGAGTYADLKATANFLGGASFMNCTCDGGTGIVNFINGKAKYINNEAGAGKTVFPFQTVFGLGTNDKGPPTFTFLLGELKDKEDVELLVSYHDANGYDFANPDFDPTKPEGPTNPKRKFYGGHYVTMTGLTLNDGNNNGGFDMGEALKLMFIDPLTGMAGSANASLDGFGFDTDYGTGGAVTGASISAIVAESPIPEAETLLLLTTGCLFLAIRRRRPAA